MCKLFILLILIPFCWPVVLRKKNSTTRFYCLTTGCVRCQMRRWVSGPGRTDKETGIRWFGGHTEETYDSLRAAMDKVGLEMLKCISP
jgi:hypothetical protein